MSEERRWGILGRGISSGRVSKKLFATLVFFNMKEGSLIGPYVVFPFERGTQADRGSTRVTRRPPLRGTIPTLRQPLSVVCVAPPGKCWCMRKLRAVRERPPEVDLLLCQWRVCGSNVLSTVRIDVCGRRRPVFAQQGELSRCAWSAATQRK